MRKNLTGKWLKKRDLCYIVVESLATLLPAVMQKENVPNELMVVYNGITYYPVSYELSFDDKGNVIHKAILHDLYANAVKYADLERVTKYEH